tara:strand:- start:38 stop:289 length:252 start_codon:yes stop_codon:yes gene_type:complete
MVKNKRLSDNPATIKRRGITTKQILLPIEAELHSELKAYAAMEGLFFSDFVRNSLWTVVKEYRRRYKEAVERAEVMERNELEF